MWPGRSRVNVVRNVKVFTHSMGNLILASALAQGFCSLDKTELSGSRWFSLGAPWAGSVSAEKALRLDKLQGPKTAWNPLRWFGSLGRSGAAYESLPRMLNTGAPLIEYNKIQ